MLRPEEAESAGPGSNEKPLGEIQIPDLLILRTSHQRKEEETTKLSISSLIPIHWGGQPGLVCSYIYPQISGMADLCDTRVNSTPSVAITRKLSHNCNLLTLNTTPPHQAPATKLLSQLQEVSPWGFLGSVRMPILVATTYGRAPKSRAPVSLLPHASELPILWSVVNLVQNSVSQSQRPTLLKPVLPNTVC